jgi:cytochrome c oxidase subunit 2
MPDISGLLGMPVNASAHGSEIDYMMGLVHWLMLILFVIWTPFFIYTLVRFRKSRNPKASYVGAKGRLSTYQEIGVVVFEVVLLAGFAFPIWGMLKKDFPPEKDAMVVHVVAEQFAWNIHYPGQDGVFGKRSPDLVDTDTNPLGLDSNDPFSKDDIATVNELHLPAEKSVIIHLTSKDVIHSFTIPSMRVKQDAIPGLNIPIWFTPTKTGEYQIGCAQLCGLGHYRMRGYVTIHTQSGFEEWLKTILEEKEQFGYINTPDIQAGN